MSDEATGGTVVAMGGGGFSMEPENPLLDEFVLSLCEASSPSVCFVPTASGDSDDYIARFYEGFDRFDCQPTHLSLFQRDSSALNELILAQDVIYVGGGNTANMLAIWRLHGLDELLRDAWAAGVVMAGLSAGSLCWFECGVTDSFGPDLAPLQDGLGLLPGSHCPHYDGEERRRPIYTSLVQSGVLPAGYAMDDGAALVFRGRELVDGVSSRPEARAFRVEPGSENAVEQPIHLRFLGS